MAKIVAVRASEPAARYGTEIMGGCGMSMESDMHRHFRDDKQMMLSTISDEMAKNCIAMSHGLPRGFWSVSAATEQRTRPFNRG